MGNLGNYWDFVVHPFLDLPRFRELGGYNNLDSPKSFRIDPTRAQAKKEEAEDPPMKPSRSTLLLFSIFAFLIAIAFYYLFSNVMLTIISMQGWAPSGDPWDQILQIMFVFPLIFSMGASIGYLAVIYVIVATIALIIAIILLIFALRIKRRKKRSK